MKRIGVLLFFLLLNYAHGQVYPQIGARANALGTTSLCLQDAWSVYNNPGAFAMMDHHEVGVAYENRFLLKELSTQSLAFGYHTEKAGNIGVHVQQYGFSLYRETIAGLVYGMKLFDNFSAGVQLNYHRIALADNYGSKNTVSAGLGLFYSFNKDFDLGFRVLNLNRSRLAEQEDERLPTTFSLGGTYHFSEKVLWSVEAEKTMIHPINFKSGLEFSPHEILALRLGMNSYPFQATFGFGLKLKKFQLDMASMWHTNLGLSPSAGMKFEF